MTFDCNSNVTVLTFDKKILKSKTNRERKPIPAVRKTSVYRSLYRSFPYTWNGKLLYTEVYTEVFPTPGIGFLLRFVLDLRIFLSNISTVTSFNLTILY